jgi:hypothetical protein
LFNDRRPTAKAHPPADLPRDSSFGMGSVRGDEVAAASNYFLEPFPNSRRRSVSRACAWNS